MARDLRLICDLPSSQRRRTSLGARPSSDHPPHLGAPHTAAGAAPGLLRAACTCMHSPTRPSARPLARWCAVVAPFWLAAAYPKAIDALCGTHTTPAPSSSSSSFHHQLRTHTSSPATLPRLPLVRTPGIHRRASGPPPLVACLQSPTTHPSRPSPSQVVSSEETQGADHPFL